MFVWLSDTLDRAESTISIYSSLLLSIIFAVILVFLATGKINTIAIITMIIVTGLIFILMSNANSSNLAGSLPSTTYPLPPHLGLDGIPHH
jgi:hypothetical protein